MTHQSITQPQMVWSYFNAKLGLHPSDDFRGVCHLTPQKIPGTAVDMDDVAVAVGYNGFIGRTCCMHVVVSKPEHFSRRMLREAFEYPFNVCGVEAVLALVDSTNEAAIDFDKRIGFKHACTIDHAGLEGDLVILHMHRADCRWLRPH